MSVCQSVEVLLNGGVPISSKVAINGGVAVSTSVSNIVGVPVSTSVVLMSMCQLAQV
jgi:hypothetical protein